MLNDVKTIFDKIKLRSTSCNMYMVVKELQQVGFNDVGRSCINLLHPFGQALRHSLSMLSSWSLSIDVSDLSP